MATIILCAQCKGFDENREATCTAQYLPSRQNDHRYTSREYLCASCANNPAIYCNILPLDEAPDEDAPKEPSPYSRWFQDLLDQDQVCEDREGFEIQAHQGYISYGISMTDGHYAPEDFDAWVIGFRKDPIPSLYYGNDSRNELAPRANSYARITAAIFG